MTASTARRLAASRPGHALAPVNEWRATLVLAAREARLIVRHPLCLAGAALTCITPFIEVQPHVGTRAAYFEVGLSVVALDGILTFFAVHLCATRSSRSRAEDWFDAAVTSRASRTAALCLATLAPFALACLMAAVLDPIVSAWAGRPSDPGPVRLLGSTLCVLGAGLLAIAVARWMRFVGAPIVTMVAVIAASVWLDNRGHLLLEPFTDWGRWDGTGGVTQSFVGAIPGSPAWHALYITGWSCLALCAALSAHRRWRYPALAAAVAAAALTVIAGVAQLP